MSVYSFCTYLGVFNNTVSLSIGSVKLAVQHNGHSLSLHWLLCHDTTPVSTLQLVSLASDTADPPRIVTHPHGVKNAIPEKPVTFSVQATGTEPLNYQWECKIGDGSGGWQLCDVESFAGANSSTLTIPSVQKSNEGSYRCTISNCAGSETSQCATLIVGKLNLRQEVSALTVDV